MGMSVRSRRWLTEHHRRRQAARDAAEQAERAIADAYHAEFLDRQRAADFLGISPHRLKRLMTAGRGPACVKSGTAMQAHVRWPIGELRAYRADPEGYVRSRHADAPAEQVPPDRRREATDIAAA